MVSGVSTGSPIGVVSMTAVRYAQPAAGEPILPVRPAQVVNATFRHIQVRPDTRLESGVPIYKLRILDALIDHLSPRQPAARGYARVDAASVDSMIAEMSHGLRGAFSAGSLPQPGAFVDLVA